MTKVEAVKEFKESHKGLIERCLKENDLAEIELFWRMSTDGLYTDGCITRKQWMDWKTPKFK